MDEQQRESRLTRFLNRNDAVLAAYCIAAAFGTYFCMYAFRKPFTAAKYEGLTFAGVAFKTVLVSAQVSGYTLSKFIGIKVISEMPANRRALSILGLIGVAELALLGFAVLPQPLKVVMLFINGLPLGMVFGLVLAYLEGRKLTEALSAGLCASFIMSSGVVKSVGEYLLVAYGVTEYWMPFLTGLIFLPGLLLAVWLLQQVPPPSDKDVALRGARNPMTPDDRRNFLRQHGFSFGLLVLVFLLLTIIRSVRDDFGVEIWERLLDGEEQPSIYGKTETVIAFAVTIIAGLAIAIKNNRSALLGSLYMTAGGFAMVLLAIWGQRAGALQPFPFMVLVGFGMYLPYVVFHTTIFERLIASIREPLNIGYLMYIADATGYLGYVGLMLVKDRGSKQLNMLQIFNNVTFLISSLSLVIMVVVIVHFRRYLRTHPVEEV